MTPALRSVLLGGGSGVAGKTVILLAAGQSNMVGYDTSANVSSTLDAPTSDVVQYMNPLGPEILPASVASGDSTSGWTAAACSIASTGGRLVATYTSGSNPRFYRTVSGLTAGATYLVQGKMRAVEGNVVAYRIDSPQTQRGILSAEEQSLRFAFVSSSTSATLYFINNNATLPASSQFSGDDFSIREILSPGAGAWNEFSQRDAMDWPDAILGSGTPVVALSAPGTSPASHAAKTLISRGAAKVIIIPCAVGGTKLVASPAEWGIGGSRYTDALAKLQDVVSANPSALVRLLWIQGEADAVGSVGQSAYESAFEAVIAGFRNVAPRMKVVVGSMVPEYISGNAPVAVIDTAQRAVVSRDKSAVYVAGPSGYGRDANLHYTSAGIRILGASLGAAI